MLKKTILNILDSIETKKTKLVFTNRPKFHIKITQNVSMTIGKADITAVFVYNSTIQSHKRLCSMPVVHSDVSLKDPEIKVGKSLVELNISETRQVPKI